MPADDRRALRGWLRSVRDDQRAERRDWRAFARRCWRHQPVLSGLQLAFVIGAGVLRLGDGPRWLTAASLGCLVGAFVCFVLLVRRDEPPG